MKRFRRGAAAIPLLGGALGTLVLGVVLLLTPARASACDFYNTDCTTTTTTSSTSSTTTSSTSSTTTSSTVAAGSPGDQEAKVSATTVAPGTSVSVTVPTSQTSSSSSPGPCAAGAAVTINLQLLQDGAPAEPIGSNTSGSDGSVPSTSVTIPTTTPLGTYVIYASCPDASGNTVDVTSPMVLVSGNSSIRTAYAPEHFVAASSAGTPAQQATLTEAVNAEIARSDGPDSAAAVGNVSALPAGGLHLVVPKDMVFKTPAPDSSAALSYGLAAAVVVMLGIGLVSLRRRRSAPEA